MLGIVCSFFVPQENLTIILTNILYCIFLSLSVLVAVMLQCKSQTVVIVTVTRARFELRRFSDMPRPLFYSLECFFKMGVFYSWNLPTVFFSESNLRLVIPVYLSNIYKV